MDRVSHEDSGSTLRHLVDVVKGPDRRGDCGQAVPVKVAEERVKCINCGYIQEGQRVDRCPECGLLWASLLHDPTCWSFQPNSRHLLLTALDVWRWDRRTRVRTALVPITPESARFASLCALVSAVILAIVFTVVLNGGSSSGEPPIALFAAEILLGSVLGYGLLRVVIWAMRLTLQGTWRRGLCFVPASIHYSAAWWLPIALFMLLFAAFFAADPRWDDRAVVMSLAALFGVVAWASWLWSSVGESGHVSFPGLRIAALVIVFFIAAYQMTACLWALQQVNSATAFVRVVTKPGGPNALGQTALSTPAVVPRTYALVVDCISGGDEQLVLSIVSRLGASSQTSVVLTGQGATVGAIEQAFEQLGSRIRKGDRFIVYLNAMQVEGGRGAIQVANGRLAVQKLRYWISTTQTNRTFVIFDCPSGEGLIEGLRGPCSAVVLASRDYRSAAFRSGLTPFWQAMTDPEADWNVDGRITIKEADLHSREKLDRRPGRRMVSRRLPAAYNGGPEAIGMLPPKLETLGDVDADDFYVQPSPSPSRASQPSS
ncbi:MAG TPA: hypothetical protein PKY77_07550 [Phycisphaerae bacterium]|nr:hypothetical protein [Phycisphaerae bacterium]HRY67857.1 hypothetical protein [Phycisphaerae bacterium]HSA25310.1 hypothetical protein [Phycisphaerae bacterium]